MLIVLYRETWKSPISLMFFSECASAFLPVCVLIFFFFLWPEWSFKLIFCVNVCDEVRIYSKCWKPVIKHIYFLIHSISDQFGFGFFYYWAILFMQSPNNEESFVYIQDEIRKTLSWLLSPEGSSGPIQKCTVLVRNSH